MKLSRYFRILLLAMFVLSLSPLVAEEAATADTEVTADAEDSDDRKRKKKKKKKSTKKKSKKSEAADDEQASKDEGEADAAEELSKVAKALGKFKVLNAKANLKADYYLYLYSASWCRHCKETMPVAMAEYKKMRSGKKVEMLIIGGDKSEGEALKYLKEFKSKNPCIMFDAVKATGFTGLPGSGLPGFPALFVVTKDGQLITHAIGGGPVKELLANWKKHTTNRDKRK